MEIIKFQEEIKEGIPNKIPEKKKLDENLNHAPKRKDILNLSEKRLALKNALRYFPRKHHKELSLDFKYELSTYGRIYMYRYKPTHKIVSRNINDYPGKSIQAKAIMLMIQNNLDNLVAQHPEELITYGGNGSVFQNWAQYRLCMKYLSEMDDSQTLCIYSGHPIGLFPSHENSPRVVVTNGMVIPNYSKTNHLEKFNALGVSQFGQMTAGSFMYIGPQGIVHGTTLTLLNVGRKISKNNENLQGKLFLSSGLGGMSGAQPKAGNIVKCISVIAEVNLKAIKIRHSQGWVDEIFNDLNLLSKRVIEAKKNKEVVSIAYHGNIVDVWGKFLEKNIFVDIGSDQTSLHNPWSGGYYPVGISFENAKKLISKNPSKFKKLVKQTLIKHSKLINDHCKKGTYFFDYGNAFLLEASRAGGNLLSKNGKDFIYPSYIQDIIGPICFDYGFGPFRWICATNKISDLEKTDEIALKILQEIYSKSPNEIKKQLSDNITWIKEAKKNNLVVGCQSRILYADSETRIKIAKAFNYAISKKIIGPVILGRDHHDVSGTDSPYRETSNIYDGSKFTADMAIQNVIGDSFRGATWVSIHNGGGVGWGEVINGGFGLVLDGSKKADLKLSSMLFWDVNNGIARRNWARNKEAIFAIKRAMKMNKKLKITIPNIADESLIEDVYDKD